MTASPREYVPAGVGKMRRATPQDDDAILGLVGFSSCRRNALGRKKWNRKGRKGVTQLFQVYPY